MGLIKAALGAAGGNLADQWIDFFTCDALPADVLVCKGQKQSSSRSSNKKGSDNVITDGSGIVVADGQCMIIVEQGKVIEICAEAGMYTYRSDLAPTIFMGTDLEASVRTTFDDMVKRFKMGGATGKEQRVYYFNTKELMDNKFGTANPIPFRVVDANVGLDIDLSVRCNGIYSYKIVDPILFYTNVCGNVESEFTREDIDAQLKTEFISALQPAFGQLSGLGIRPNQIVMHNTELEQAMNSILSAKWAQTRGLKVVSVAIGSVTLPEEDQQLLKNTQAAAAFKDPALAGANIARAQAEAMVTAAGNEGGAMTGFMGMGMAMNAGSNAQNLFAMGQQQQMAQPQQPAMPQQPQAQAQGSWTCTCGQVNTGKFCPNCGSPMPVSNKWTCSCGQVNEGNFCPNCGAKKPQ